MLDVYSSPSGNVEVFIRNLLVVLNYIIDKYLTVNGDFYTGNSDDNDNSRVLWFDEIVQLRYQG